MGKNFKKDSKIVVGTVAVLATLYLILIVNSFIS